MNAAKVAQRVENFGLLRTVLESTGHFLLGVLVCRGTVFGDLAPFGGSYVAAVPKKQLFWATLGTSVGYIISAPSNAFRYVGVTVAIALARWLVQDIRRISRSALFAPLAAFVPIFASGIAMMFTSTSTITDFSQATVEAILAGAAAYFFSRTLTLIDSNRRLSTFSRTELACLVMTSCVALLSLGGIEVEDVSLGRILAIAVILVCARYGSAAGGSVAGAAVGAVFGMSTPNVAYICAGYSFGGLIGGLFAPVGKLGVTLGFVVCNLIMMLSGAQGSRLVPLIAEAVIGSAVFMLLPDRLERYITPLFLPRENSSGELAIRNALIMRLGFASSALRNISGCVNSVSRQLSKLYAPSVEVIYENTAEDVCKSCGLCAFCWERQQAVTKKDFARLEAPLRSQGYVTENDVENLFSKKCCRGVEVADSLTQGYRDYLGGEEAARRVAQIRTMVAGQFGGLSDILDDLSGEIEHFRSYEPELSARVLEYLHGEGYVPVDCGCMLDSEGRMSVEIQLGRGKTPLRRKALASDISELCGRCFDTPLITEVGTRRRIVLNEVPMFDAEVGVYQHVFGGGKLCGDCVNCFTAGFGTFVALISDGMGTGGRAAVDSNMTVSILTKLIKAGLGANVALGAVNSALMVKSEDESLATVDMLSLDLFTGRATLSKAGAPYSIIRKGGHLLRKNAASLPVGILGDVKFSAESARLDDGDLIVLMSDGVMSADDHWLETMIRTSGDTCADLSRKIVEEARSRRKEHDDDITAVCVRLHSNIS